MTMNSFPDTSSSPAMSLETTLKSIVEGTAATTGEHFFQSLVQYLAVALGVDVAFVAEFSPERNLVRTLSLWVAGEQAENLEFPLEGTPCELVLTGAIQHFPENIQQRFPQNNLLRTLNAQSYLAIPLMDEQGMVIGHLAVIDSKPLPADERELSIFHIFAARAASELIRLCTRQELQVSRSREQQLRSELADLKAEIQARSDFSEIVGSGPGILNVLQNIELVAATDSTVLILGETGTGKELVARAIHQNSPRSEGPFIKVNCAALPESLLESELFGHEAGAFTGATSQRAGRFELADGGTIFLDEIGEMPLVAQSRLLRILQEQELERVGGTSTIPVNTRVLAATNRDLLQRSQENQFREDLYYRLNVFPIELPALRERLEDIPDLVQAFVQKLGSRLGRTIERIPERVLAAFQNYSWPGNIRELENVVERTMILSRENELALPVGLLEAPKGASPCDPRKTLAEVEKEYISSVLSQTEGVIAGPKGAARILGLNPNTLRSRMKKLGLFE